MIIDTGTGDGRAVLASAAADPRTLAIGSDADARSMAESSRRAGRPATKGGLPNALFVVASIERVPTELAGRAELVTVRFPWGSLLRGCLGADPTVVAGLATLVGDTGSLELILAPGGRDRFGNVAVDPRGAEPGRADPATIANAVMNVFGPCGLDLVEARAMTPDELSATRSTWARRLGTTRPGGSDRVATLLRLRRTGIRASRLASRPASRPRSIAR